MSERFSLPHTATSATPGSARPERRQSRRAGVSLPVRLRAAAFEDGNFEEIRTTLNVSRKAIYFFTRSDRYYQGMRLRITSPYDPKPGVADLEQDGEVVRIQAIPGGYGVAVTLAPANSLGRASVTYSAFSPTQIALPSAPTASVATHVEIERRCASRSPFIAPVELLDMRTGSRLHARIADLSLRGCYVDTLNPLPVGSAVRLQIHRNDEIFDTLANVSSSHAGSGMGVVFADLSLTQRETLRSWLGESALPPEIGFSAPSRPTRRVRRAEDSDQLYAVRLIHALVRKGLLSKSEASELLADPEG